MDIFANEDEGYSLDVPKEKRLLNTMAYDYSIEYLYNLIKKGKIVLEVPFQRNHIWKNDKASLLIESIIMNVPIPPIYFAEEEDGRWLVLDGLQRLYSIMNYYDNEFQLSKLEVLEELQKMKYKDLPPKAKSLLNDGLLRVNVIKKDSHRDIKYDIFMRLNRGAVTLNYQELRNCLYRGNLNNAAKELCHENTEFLKILRQKKPHSRYLDVEFIIRYFAVSDNIMKDENGNVFINSYKGKLVAFLNEYMDNNKDCSLEEKEKYKIRFNETIEKIIIVFGTDKAFRDISTNNVKVYKTIADFIMPSFERMSKEYVESNKDKLLSLTQHFLEKKEIQDLLLIKTSDKDVMNKKINEWFKEIKDEISF
ncbi:MAG TPA: hypothetical protein DIC60_09660 [Lachnospiraceae bacterium]|nr:hypothetical protein [Lachnospiraceae bacterium]